MYNTSIIKPRNLKKKINLTQKKKFIHKNKKFETKIETPDHKKPQQVEKHEL